jgi:hypothetical protein
MRLLTDLLKAKWSHKVDNGHGREGKTVKDKINTDLLVPKSGD